LFGYPFTKTRVEEVVPPTLAHEFEHMISAGYRLEHYGLTYVQERWLDEGMAHMAEDLNGMNDENIRRVVEYLKGPWKIPLEGGDSLEQRGGIYLFLRYLGDIFGNGIFRSMVQSPYVGSPTIEYVAGEPFFDAMARWLAALYFSALGKDVPVAPEYRYSNTTVANLGTALDSLAVETRLASQGSFGGSIATSSGRFYVLEGAPPPAIKLTVSFTGPAAVRTIVTRIR